METLGRTGHLTRWKPYMPLSLSLATTMNMARSFFPPSFLHRQVAAVPVVAIVSPAPLFPSAVAAAVNWMCAEKSRWGDWGGRPASSRGHETNPREGGKQVKQLTATNC